MNNKIESLFIDDNYKIIDALKVMNKAAHIGCPPGIALVTKNNKLQGVICDGDIRRALVNNISLNDTIKNIYISDPVTVKYNQNTMEMFNTVINEVKKKDRLNDYKVDKVIVVDENQNVVDIVNFYDLLFKRDIKNKNICVFGMGYVGLTLSLVLANLDLNIKGFDIDKKIVEDLNAFKTHFYEAGLDPLLKYHLENKNISFTHDIKKINSDIYIISVGTPINEKNKKPDLSHIKEVSLYLGNILKKEDLVILRSTVPVGTTRNVVLPILEKVSKLTCGEDFYLVFAPERTIEGKALEELRELPQPIGGYNKASAEAAEKLFQLISPSVIMLDSLEEAELLKLINNTFRDVSFGYSNQLATFCDSLGIDTVKIIKAANTGYKRNPIPLPSPGVGGACLKKDPYIFMDMTDKHNLNCSIVKEARKANEYMPFFVVNKTIKFIRKYYKDEKKIKIFILGLAFKGYPETSDVRNSPSIDYINALKSKLPNYNIDICGYDAVVKKEDLKEYGIKYQNYKEGFKDSHCVLILNNHPDFPKLDIFNYLKTMKNPGFFFDGWYLFSPKEILKVKGISYEGIGGFN